MLVFVNAIPVIHRTKFTATTGYYYSMVLSHPGADRSISIEGLKSYRAVSHRYRNRRIGEFLKELHLTEGRNTGFQKIIRALKANGSPMPVFETDEERTYFLTTIPIHPDFLVSPENEHINQTPEYNLTDLEQRVLAAIQEDATVTIQEMAVALKSSRSTIVRALKSLQEQRIIVRIGSRKTGMWKILK